MYRINKIVAICISCVSLGLLFACSEQVDNTPQSNPTEQFFELTMNSAPFLPLDQSGKAISCPVATQSSETHTTSKQANYNQYDWENRVAHDWSFFNSTAQQGRILLIDIKQQDEQAAYRYLANNATHEQVYEPWSSSKIFAFTGAIAQLRYQYGDTIGSQLNLAQGIIGEHHIADMITSINSYDPFSKADGNSNALATFFANLATRDYLSDLFYDEWLKLSAPNIYFRGAYGPSAFEPSNYTWNSPNLDISLPFEMNNIASDDPGYLPYRCEDCDLTGNKPMTTLAQAEWLKRLAMHNDDPDTAHPYLKFADIETLFYGIGHSQQPEKFAGMTLGISTMLQQAIAKHLSNNNQTMTPQIAKSTLDKATKGQWRVFQKIGWGPSETRSTSENVVLAYVCLPHYQGGKAFVVAAQVAVPEAKDENVALAGEKMQVLLDKSMAQYLSKY
jgi:hypothetical protein